MKKNKYVIVAVLIIFSYVAFGQDTMLVSGFRQSEQFESKTDYKSAIEVLKKVYDKSSYEINLRLGWLNYMAKQYTESEAYYSKAIEIKPNAIEPRLYYVEPAAALGNTNDLLAQYNKVLEIDPTNSNVNYWVGVIYYNKKDYQTALKYFDKLISLYPFDYSSLLMDAWTKYQLGRNKEAKPLFQKVLEISANDKSANQGISLINDASNATLTDQLDLAPFFNRSEDFESKKDFKSAADVMLKVYDKNSYEINLRLGWLEYLDQQYTQSESYYKKAIELSPNSIEPRKGYTYALNALSKTDELINQYNKILQMDSLDYDANYYMGLIYYNKKDYSTARKYLDKLIALYPFGYDGLILDARNKFNLGNKAEAKVLFEKVLLITPTDMEVQSDLYKIDNPNAR